MAARLLCDKVSTLHVHIQSPQLELIYARQHYDLSAVFMRNWDQRDETGTDEGCAWKQDWEDVQSVCKHLDIPCRMVRRLQSCLVRLLIDLDWQVDLSRQYWLRVFVPALKQWELGQTPNPDVWCNKFAQNTFMISDTLP